VGNEEARRSEEAEGTVRRDEEAEVQCRGLIETVVSRKTEKLL